MCLDQSGWEVRELGLGFIFFFIVSSIRCIRSSKEQECARSGYCNIGLVFSDLYEQRECGTCVCVWVAVVLGGGGGSWWVTWAKVLEDGVVLCLDSLRRWAGPGICILC